MSISPYRDKKGQFAKAPKAKAKPKLTKILVKTPKPKAVPQHIKDYMQEQFLLQRNHLLEAIDAFMEQILEFPKQKLNWNE